MFAVIIGYNAFFVPEVPQIIQTIGNVSEIIEKEPDITEERTDGLVNINTAPAEEMVENLNGVGKVIAERIIDYREKSGDFASIEELMNVRGIGEKVFEKIKDDITV